MMQPAAPSEPAVARYRSTAEPFCAIYGADNTTFTRIVTSGFSGTDKLPVR